MPVYGIIQDGTTLFGGGVVACILGAIILGGLVLLATALMLVGYGMRDVASLMLTASLVVCGILLDGRTLAAAAGWAAQSQRTLSALTLEARNRRRLLTLKASKRPLSEETATPT